MKKLIKFYKNFVEQSQKFKKLSEILKKIFEILDYCENVELGWNFKGKLFKFYKKKKILEILCKLEIKFGTS